MHTGYFKYVMIVGLLLLVPGLISAAPQHKGREYYEEKGDMVWEVPTDEKVIALTFDDGPDPVDTPQIVALFKQYEGKATFFAVGKKVDLYPQIAKMVVAEGHELGNHTYTHLYLNNRATAEVIAHELKATQNAILRATGTQTAYFRPPGGFYNETLVNTAKKLGYKIVMWSWHQDTKDWRRPGTDKIVRKVLNNARNGDIVLFHDYVEGKTQTIEALKKILPELKRRGYRFVTVSELIKYGKGVPVKMRK